MAMVNGELGFEKIDIAIPREIRRETQAFLDSKPFVTVINGKRHGLGSMVNYIISAIRGVGARTNDFDPAGTCLNFSRALIKRGCQDVLEDQSMEAQEIQKFRQAWFGRTPEDNGSLVYDHSLLREEVEHGILKRVCKTFEEACKILTAAAEADWRNPEHVAVIAEDLEAVKRFVQETTIDSTKKLPKDGVHVPFEDRMAVYKKGSKVHEITVTRKWDEGAFKVSGIDFKPEELELIKDKKGRTQTCAAGLPLYKGVMYDQYHIARVGAAEALVVFNEDATRLNTQELPAKLKAECLRLVGYQKYSQLCGFISHQKAMRKTVADQYAVEEAAILESVKDNRRADQFESWEKIAKQRRRDVYNAIENNLRIAYQTAGIDPVKMIKFMLGICVKEDEMKMSDFARQALPAEWALFTFAVMREYAPDSTAFKTTNHLRRCVRSAVGNEYYFEDGIAYDEDGAFVAQASQVIPDGMYSVAVDEEGNAVATRSIEELIRKSIPQARREDGVAFRLRFAGEEKMSSREIQQRLSMTLNALRGNEVKLISYKQTPHAVLRDAVIARIEGKAYCVGNYAASDRSGNNSVFNNVLHDVKGRVAQVVTGIYRNKDGKVVPSAILVLKGTTDMEEGEAESLSVEPEKTCAKQVKSRREIGAKYAKAEF